MVSATASVCRQGDWKWLAGAAPISGNGAAPPQRKKLSSNTRPGRAGRSKPRHRNGPFDWVAIHSLIERQVKADRGGGSVASASTFALRSRSVAVFLAKVLIPRRKSTIGTG